MTVCEPDDDLSLTSAYASSSLVKYLSHKPTKLAFIDIDTTFTGTITLLKKVKKKLEDLGFALIFVTSRTEELVMSKTQFEKSKKFQFSRPKPNILHSKNGFSYIDPAKENPHLVDPEIIIGTTGTQIYVKQKNGGYKKDKLYETLFEYTPDDWRKKIFSLLEKIDPEKKLFSYPLFEFEENYIKKQANVFPPAFRIQLRFTSLENKLTFLKRCNAQFKRACSDIIFTDDSNPKKGKFILYITPAKAGKTAGVEHVVNAICKTASILFTPTTRQDLQVILAGDSYADLDMLLHGARGTHATSILVGGSRLSDVLINNHDNCYAGENISGVKKNLLSLADNVRGHYNFIARPVKDNMQIARDIIIGEVAYPQTLGPETILAFLEEISL